MPQVEKLNLSDHTLDINTGKCDINKFDFSEVEEFVRELAGGREYQFEAIKDTLIYLWGGIYKDANELAKENYGKKEAIQHRFQSEENFLRRLPLPDRLSGVVHMATGTGKSYVMFAIAFLSIVMGKVKRVLVLGPSSTVIESGLRGKFKEYLYGPTGIRLKSKLPLKYQNIPIKMLDENLPIEDYSIVIENINSIYNKDRNSIGDTLFSQTDEVLVLSDEVHHAYSHLKYVGDMLTAEDATGRGEDLDERLWMKFIREEQKIKKHIGFTGTPYNQDEYFVDVIYDYSIKDALDDKYIKKPNPIIHTESDTGDADLTLPQKFEQILITHDKNKEKYSYADANGKARLKPITIFINRTQANAKTNTDEFIDALKDYLKNNNPALKSLSNAQLADMAREKVICVISNPTDADYQEKLDCIEEIDPGKPGGKVEYIFAVNKLSEGWDVDNVYQIVPMQEKAFDSKLLISQVLGRGLRLPRSNEIPYSHILNNYPVVTITNHEKFAPHIVELLNAVINCETRFESNVIRKSSAIDRAKNNFELFNLEYVPAQKVEDVATTKQDMTDRTLKLIAPIEKLHLRVEYLKGSANFALTKPFYTVDEIVADIAQRFAMRQFENLNFDFGDGIVVNDLPRENDIEAVIRNAMKKANFIEDKLSEDNRKAIDLFFNQFLPRGKSRVVRTNIEGDIKYIKTEEMSASSVRSGELDRYKSVFISEDYENELSGENKFVIKDLEAHFKAQHSQQVMMDFAGSGSSKYIRQIIPSKPIYVVNTSVFKCPQNLVIVSHKPERAFVFRLIDHFKYITSWLKSRDMDFYSLDYEYFKGGKDRVRKSFNPDFFIRIDLDTYIDRLREELPSFDPFVLKDLQDQGIKTLIRVVEIKSDEDKEEVTRAKERWGKEHFERVSKRLKEVNPIDLPQEFRSECRQHYTFDVLRPESYDKWFAGLRGGWL